MSAMILINATKVGTRVYWPGENIDSGSKDYPRIVAQGGEFWPANNAAISQGSALATLERTYKGADNFRLESIMRAAVSIATQALASTGNTLFSFFNSSSPSTTLTQASWNILFADTTTASFSASLPPNPNRGDRVTVIDQKQQFPTHGLLLTGNAGNLMVPNAVPPATMFQPSVSLSTIANFTWTWDDTQTLWLLAP